MAGVNPGYSSGDGYGCGYGYGHGFGDGYGVGSGSGFGYGFGSSSGKGDGYGDGSSSSSSYCFGDGSGDGYGSGFGDGDGVGSGDSDLGTVCGYSCTVSLDFGIVRLACQIHTLVWWREHWQEVARDEGVDETLAREAWAMIEAVFTPSVNDETTKDLTDVST